MKPCVFSLKIKIILQPTQLGHQKVMLSPVNGPHPVEVFFIISILQKLPQNILIDSGHGRGIKAKLLAVNL